MSRVEAGEEAQWLGATPAASTAPGSSQLSVTSGSREADDFFWILQTLRAHTAQTHIQAKYPLN